MIVPAISRRNQAGFVLLLTLVLLSTVLLILVALGALTRVETASGTTSTLIWEARQNALFSLRLAIGQVQRFAGAEDVVTSPSGAVDPASPNPDWTGVWPVINRSTPSVWLVSGNETTPLLFDASAPAPSESVQLMQTPQVRVPKVGIVTRRPSSASAAIVGRYGYWVCDETNKIAANVPSDAPLPGGISAYPSLAGVPGYSLSDAEKKKLLIPEQFAGLTAAQRRWVTVSTARLDFDTGGPILTMAPFNVNSPFTEAWKALLPAAIAETANVDYQALAEQLVAAAHPFRSITEFQSALTSALDSLGGDKLNDVELASSIVHKFEPLLSVRGDTFLIRAYGEVADPVDSGAAPLATAYCEARIQRIPFKLADTNGWKFVITYFRWLGPDDI